MDRGSWRVGLIVKLARKQGLQQLLELNVSNVETHTRMYIEKDVKMWVERGLKRKYDQLGRCGERSKSDSGSGRDRLEIFY